MTAHPVLRHALGLSTLPTATKFPRQLEEEVPLHLPLAIISIPNLTAFNVRDWLCRREINHQIASRDRPLHGTLVAHAGRGVVFLDQCDEENEQRFTLAHETAHFLLDHLVPRTDAIRALGKSVVPVLDGVRTATKEEAVAAVLRQVRLGIQVHMMERTDDGSISRWEVEDSEQLADLLALEILAPPKRVQKELKALGDIALDQAATYLISKFGLPVSIALSYARQIRQHLQPRPSFTQSLRSGR